MYQEKKEKKNREKNELKKINSSKFQVTKCAFFSAAVITVSQSF